MKLLLVAVSTETESFIKKYFNIAYDLIDTLESFEGLLSADANTQYPLILAGKGLAEIPPVELAQTLKNIYPQSRIIYISEKREGFDRLKFLKNGFDDTYILPSDDKYLKEELRDFDLLTKGKESLKPIRIMDLQPDTILNFHIFIHLEKNDKYIKFVAAGSPIESEKLEKLKTNQYDVVFVPQDQIKEFYNYTAKLAQKIGDRINSLSRTQQLDQLQKEIRKLFTLLMDDVSVADFEFGKNIMEVAKNIVSNLIQPHSTNNWFETLKNNLAIGETDIYSHNLNTSVYASLIASGLGYKNIEDFAMAGLFHDLGLVDMPREMLYKSYVEMSPDERVLYEKHPQETLTYLKNKRIIISPLVQKMIFEHHEKLNQTGFPTKTDPTKLSHESQILAIAEEIETRTQFSTRDKKKNIIDLLQSFIENRDYDLDLLNKIKLLLLESRSQS